MTRKELKIEIGKIGYEITCASNYMYKQYLLHKLTNELCDKLELKD